MNITPGGPWLVPLLFFYGLTFFALGLALAVSYYHYRPRPGWPAWAERLKLLAYFGFWHGLAEWGLLFGSGGGFVSPAGSVPTPLILVEALMAVSFVFLLEFALSFGWPKSGRTIWLIGLFLLWGFGVLLWDRQNGAAWGVTAEVTARYLLALPGGLLAAWRLRLAAGGPDIEAGARRDLVGLSWSFLFYALTAGLIGSPAPFFPADRLNAVNFWGAIGLPIQLFRTAAGVAILLFTLNLLRRLALEARHGAEVLRMQNALLTERERIARDLHDGAIQALYAIGLGLEGLSAAGVEEPVERGLKQARQGLEGVGLDLRLYIAGLSPADAVGGDLRQGVEEIIGRYRSITMVPIRGELSGEDLLPWGPRERGEVFRILQESLSNALKHSGATQIRVRLRLEPERLQLRVSDDGTGLPSQAEGKGRGLANLRTRAVSLGADLQLDGGDGTTIRLSWPGRPGDGNDTHPAG